MQLNLATIFEAVDDCERGQWVELVSQSIVGLQHDVCNPCVPLCVVQVQCDLPACFLLAQSRTLSIEYAELSCVCVLFTVITFSILEWVSIPIRCSGTCNRAEFPISIEAFQSCSEIEFEFSIALHV